MMKHRDQRILDKSLDSPKSDETELVPISSNKANIQGTAFHHSGPKLLFLKFMLSDPKFLILVSANLDFLSKT